MIETTPVEAQEEYRLVRQAVFVTQNSSYGWDRTLCDIFLERVSGRFQIRYVSTPPVGPAAQFMIRLSNPANSITSLMDYQNFLADFEENKHGQGTRRRIR